MESTESLLASIDIFNIVMALGIVGLLYAIHDVGKANKILHDENLRERARDRVPCGGCEPSDRP
jgi:hypothetical protein